MAALRAELRRKEQEIGELRRQLESSETELRLARTSLGALGTAQTGLGECSVSSVTPVCVGTLKGGCQFLGSTELAQL